MELSTVEKINRLAQIEKNRRKETIFLQTIAQNGTAITPGYRIRFSAKTEDIRHVTSLEINVSTVLGGLVPNVAGTQLTQVYWHQLSGFTITLVNRNNEHLIDQMPLLCFANDMGAGIPGSGLKGKIRTLDLIADMAKSFVTYNFNLAIATNLCIPLTFGYLE